tara:strand:- start:11178 stop:12677 length:1500 start_codon:yes stop_codon:yes gene_type:complete
MKPKLLFWLGADFTHFFLSYYLQKKLDADSFSIIDITKKPKNFFESQTLVNFKKSWFFHDNISPNQNIDEEYLKNFEEKYDIPIWKLAINERIFYRFYDFHKFTTNEILSIEEQSCKFFERVLDEIKPDFLITKEPAFHHLELLYQLCLKRGIKVLMLGYAPFSGKCIISQEPGKIDSINELENIKPLGRNIEQLKELLLGQKISKQIKSYDEEHTKSNLHLIKSGLKFLKQKNENVNTHYNYFGRSKSKVFLSMMSSLLKKRQRQSFIDSTLEQNVNLQTNFVYFPLAVDLERNLLIDAPFHTNQIEIIRNIAKSLPVGYTLYVKENPSQVSREWRDIDEYKSIMKIPNTSLIHPSYPSEKLLQNCSLVVNIAGTSALESTFFQKPALVFVNRGYTILPSINIVKDITTLPKLIRDSLKIKPNVVHLDQYVALLEKNSFEFNWMEFGTLFKNKFYHQGGLVDVDIPEIKIKKMLGTLESNFQALTLAHIGKINSPKLN